MIRHVRPSNEKQFFLSASFIYFLYLSSVFLSYSNCLCPGEVGHVFSSSIHSHLVRRKVKAVSREIL